MGRSNQRTGQFVLFAIAALISFASMVLYMTCEKKPASTPDASASPSPATATQSPATANQTSSGQQQQNSNTAKPEETKVTIKGTVKKEGFADPVAGAVVVLFNAERRGAEPQKTDDSGQFRFVGIPIKPGPDYSLQTKAPGLCGEESFTYDAIDAQQTISKDIVLKPCQTQATAPQTQTTKTEDPNLMRISEGVTGITGPLNSMKFWVQVLAVTLILMIVLMLLATIAPVFLNRRQVAEERARVAELYRWKHKIEGDLQKLNEAREPATATLVFPPEISETLRQLLTVLTPSSPSTPSPPNQRTESDYEPPTREEILRRSMRASTLPYEPQSYSPSENDWYRRLLQNEITSPAPLYMQINTTLSDTSPFTANRRICFDQCPNHGPFVVFDESDGAGWIFPSPGSNFTADHHRVFENLDQKNFEQQRANITKKSVIFQEGRWQLVL